MDYYSGVQGEGHFIYFDNHQSELTRISKSLKSLLPKNLYDNFLQAKKGFRENPKTYDVSLNADNFFTSNIKIIEDIIFSYSKSIII